MAGVFFADTFFWVAITHPRDAFHARAVAWRHANRSARFVTTEEVLSEVLNWFARLGSTARLSATELAKDVLADPSIQVLPQTTAGFQDAVAFYRSRLDKEYSLTDCRSMLVMRALGISDVLSNDHHFAQEGFAVLFP